MAATQVSDSLSIEHVSGFSPAEYASSPHGCQARILQSLGEALSYDDLLCFSGFAFRIGVHDAMCPSAGHPCCGYMCMEGGLLALPWRTRVFEGEQQGDRTAFEAEARVAVAQSIERGVPVHYGCEEDGLIIGVADEGKRWRCVHPYHQQGSQSFWHDEVDGFAGGKWPWGIVVWTEPKPAEERLSHRQLTVAGLQQALAMWQAEKQEAYFVGAAAYAHWLSWLSDVEHGKVDEPKGGMQGNGWCFDVLVHSRRIAGRWLRQQAAGFDGETARQLHAAADHYMRLVESCLDGLDCTWDLALGPGRFDDWTSALRKSQIARLELAVKHDGAAIERALESLPSSDLPLKGTS